MYTKGSVISFTDQGGRSRVGVVKDVMSSMYFVVCEDSTYLKEGEFVFINDPSIARPVKEDMVVFTTNLGNTKKINVVEREGNKVTDKKGRSYLIEGGRVKSISARGSMMTIGVL